MKELCFTKKSEMLKIWKLNFNKEESNKDDQWIKRLYISKSYPLFPTKSYYWSVFSPVCNEFLEQNCLDKPLSNKIKIIIHFSPMNNTVSNKIKTLSSAICYRPTNGFKTKMALLSSLINHYHQTRYHQTRYHYHQINIKIVTFATVYIRLSTCSQ